MAKKVTVETLGEEIRAILKDYEGNVQAEIQTITQKIGQKGAAAMRSKAQSTFPDGKKYAKGWKVTFEHTRLTAKATIHNSQVPGLPHLLENGHQSYNQYGGPYSTSHAPVKGVSHIAEVERELTEQYEREVKSKL